MHARSKAEKYLYLKMDALLYFPVLILSAAVGLGVTGMSPAKELYLDSYHLCNRTETKNLIKSVAYQKTSQASSLCGWIPARWCSKTQYQMEYRLIEVPETTNVTDCCEDYEQLGQYCVLSFNRSNEFTSRPGVCPADAMRQSNISCSIDLDCPGLQKCCLHSNRSTCSTPIPEAPVNNKTQYWYNATVDVKMEFVELRRLDPQFMNHARLLHSMITGALRPFNVSVHPITTVQAETFTVESLLLIGFQEPALLNEVSEKLQEIVRRIPEVININVKDVNECTYPELNVCSKEEVCRNLDGFYNCYGHHEPPGMNSSRPDDRFPDTMNSTPRLALDPFPTTNGPFHEGITTPVLSSSLTDPWCYCSTVTNLRIFSVTANSFQMSWSINSSLHHIFQVEIRSMLGTPLTVNMSAMKMVAQGLAAGTLYSVSITYQDCAGLGHTLTEKVKTDAAIVTGSLRITNYNFTETFNNTSSLEYQNFTSMLEQELLDALSHTIAKEKLRLKIISLRAGSIIAEFKVIIMDTDIAVNISRMRDSLSYLNQSKTFVIDPSSSSLEDLDECASPSENDCSPDALCINTDGPFTCKCKDGFTDLEVTRPGRNCRDTPSMTTEKDTRNSSLPMMPSTDASTSSNNTLHASVNASVSSVPRHSAPSNTTSGGNTTITNTSSSESGSHSSTTSLPVTHSTTMVPFKSAASVSSTSVHSSINTLIPATLQPSPTPLPSSTTHSSKTTTTTTTIASRGGYVSLKGNAQVECFSASIVLRISKAFLSNLHISASSLTFGEPSCNMSTTVEDLHVKLTVAWPSGCLHINTNTSHIAVSGLLLNTIQANNPGQFKVNSNVTCTYKKDIELSSGDGVVNEGEMIYDNIEAAGSFQPEFLLYSESGEVGKNGTLRTDETARIVIGINTQETTFKVVLNDCWASNSSDSSDPGPHFLIKDRCAVKGTSTAIEKNGEDKRAAFSTKIFANIDAPMVYLHCRLHICKELYEGSCKPVCIEGRSAKNSEPYEPKYAKIGPFRRAPGSSPQNAAPDSKMAPGYVVLIFLAVVSVIGAISSVLIYRYYRRTGRYDFKPKCDKRGYLVFSN
ncbi:uromodulin-like 1 isoform X2 [Pleurodeles waltl]|uniref:uromodulin-like 1 isoform X2 n=1 Tax=Pleurodeles waltl TaxID=8319 RepID=UPI003709938B